MQVIELRNYVLQDGRRADSSATSRSTSSCPSGTRACTCSGSSRSSITRTASCGSAGSPT